jgi:hypothetical protein
MKRLSFLVNRGENDCFMIHGIDWATYREGGDWSELTALIRADVEKAFSGDAKPTHLDFKFADGTVTSIPA